MMKVFKCYLCLTFYLLMAGNLSAQSALSTLSPCTVYPTPTIQPSFEAFCQEERPGDSIKGCLKVCEKTSITYETAATGNTITWEAIGDATPSTGTGSSFTVTWNSVGSGMIQVTETTSDGCSTTESKCVTVIDSPTADFTAVPDGSSGTVYICEGGEIHFQDQSSTDVISWVWDFGDGTQSNDPNPSHTFTTAGIYTTYLTVYNDCGCSDTEVVKVNVNPAAAPIIECVSTVCFYEEAVYSVSNGCPGATYTWSIEGGTIMGNEDNQVEVVWGSPTSGFGLLTVDVENCDDVCSIPTTVMIPVLTANIGLSGPDVVCVGDLVEYSVPAQPSATFGWYGSANPYFNSTPNDHSIDVNWSTSGSFDICVSIAAPDFQCVNYPNYCKTVKVKSAFGVQPPFGEICGTGTLDFNTGPSLNVNWKAIDVNGGVTSLASNSSSVTVGPLSPGLYEIRAIDASVANSYCNTEASAFLQVEAAAPGLAQSDLTGELNICPGSTYQYAATPANGHYLEWSANGGTVSGTGNEVAISWTGSAPYAIDVTQTPMQGPACPSTTPFSINTLAVGIPTFTGATVVCVDGQETYEATAVAGATDIEWEVIPNTRGSVVSGQNSTMVDVQFNNTPGTATLRYHYSICNVAYSEDYSVNVVSNPTIILGIPTDACQDQAGGPALTADLSIIPTGATINWTWDFGSTGTATSTGNSSAVTFSFPNFGTEIITVTATITGGACPSTVTATQLINIKPAPLVNITANQGSSICPPGVTSTTLTASVQNSPGGNGTYTYAWNGGPNSATYTVTSAGSYELTVTDNANGCETIKSYTVTACSSGPQSCSGVDFSSIQDCNSFDFTASLSSPWTNPTWTFGDGNAATGTNVSNVYSHSGYYSVTLTGFDGVNLCSETKQVVVQFVPGFIAEYSCTNFVGGNSMDVQLIDQTDFLPGTSLTYSWIYPGGTSTAQNPSVTGMPSGNVTLEVSDGNITCSAPVTFVTVPAPITAAISSTAPACEGSPITFTNTSTSPIADIVSATWDFGDGSGSNLIPSAERTYTYPLTGPTVNLTVTDIYGCISNASLAITVNENGLLGNVTVSAPTNPTCPSSAFQLTANFPSGTPSPTFQWYSSDMGIDLGTTNPSATVNATGEYYVEITDANGCVERSANEPVIIIPAPIAAIIGPAEVCLGEVLRWSANQGTGYSYLWTVNTPSGNSYTYINHFAIISANEQGAYTAEVTLTDLATGCAHTSAIFTTTVQDVPQGLTISGSGPNCVPANLSASVSAPSSVDYTWSTGDTGATTVALGGGTVEVTAYTDQGCVASETIEIGEGPDISDVAVGCYCFNDPVTWTAPEGDGYTYAWYQVVGSSDVLVGTAFQYNIAVSGVYYVVVTDANGCSTTSADINMDIGANCDCRFEVRPLTLECIAVDQKTGGYIYSFSSVLINSGVALTGLNATSDEGIVNTLSPSSVPAGGTSTPISGTFTLFPGYTSATISFTGVGSNGELCQYKLVVPEFLDCAKESCKIKWAKPKMTCLFTHKGYAYYQFDIAAINTGNTLTNLVWTAGTGSTANLTSSTNQLNGSTSTLINGMIRVEEGVSTVLFKVCGYDIVTRKRCCWKVKFALPECTEEQEPCGGVKKKSSKVLCASPNNDPAGNAVYDFDMVFTAPLLNGTAYVVPLEGQSENNVTNVVVNVSNDTYSIKGTIVDVPEFDEPLCFRVIISNGEEFCWLEFCVEVPICKLTEDGKARATSEAPMSVSNLKVVPNPSSSFVNISYELLGVEQVELRMVRMDGQLVRHLTKLPIAGNIRIEVEDLADGMYFLGIYQQGRLVDQQKVVVLKGN